MFRFKAQLLCFALLLTACDPPGTSPAPATTETKTKAPVVKPPTPEATRIPEQATRLHSQRQTDQAIELLETALRDHGASFEVFDALSVCYL